MRLLDTTLLLGAVCLVTHGVCRADCQPAADIEAEFQKAASAAATVADPFGALEKAAPFRAVRDRHPDDLSAHERYQNAVNDYGIEGHLRLLNQEYQALDFQHPGAPMYHYLYLRTLVGRQTLSAIQGLNDLLAAHPDFAPAHRTLAEIYATETFRDAEKENLERQIFLHICPGAEFNRWPPPVAGPSPLIDQAERALAEGADPNRVIAMTIQGLKEFEWRSQRIRAFDWYTLDFKRQDARELRGHYQQAWAIQVRCYRRMGDAEQADRLLQTMRRRAILDGVDPARAVQ